MSYDATPVSPQPQKSGSTPAVIIIIIVAGGMLFLLSCGGIMVALLLPAVQAAREAARRNACVNHMQHIGIALQNYHDVHKTFPPAYIADADGKPMHSWRVLILPFLEENEIYKKYDFNEPWDGPNNSKLAAQAPSDFRCPSGTDFDGQTNYVAVVGNETMWPGATAVKIRSIRDGLSRTIAVVETSGSGINWLEPRDLTMDEALRGIKQSQSGGINSQHPGGVNVLNCDGSVLFLPEDVPPETIRALLTISGKENVDPSSFGF
jgi:type II secretory pathway pseudopilin PulG